MARVVYSARAFDDLLRLTEFLFKEEPQAAVETADLIQSALRILEDHPFIGRQVEGGPERVLVISRGRSGYAALYRLEPNDDRVTIHAIRHQREAGFAED